jgi:hypothetical protein
VVAANLRATMRPTDLDEARRPLTTIENDLAEHPFVELATFETNGRLPDVEVIPPDVTNTARGIRLNPDQALTEWYEEWAER